MFNCLVRLKTGKRACVCQVQSWKYQLTIAGQSLHLKSNMDYMNKTPGVYLTASFKGFEWK